MRKLFLEGNTILRNKCNIKHLNHTLSTNCNGKLFFTIKRPRSCKKSFCYTSSLLKGSFIIKKTNIALVGTFGLFFVGCLSIVLIVSSLISFSKKITIIELFAFTCFLRTIIP
jgi:hypothetical protein